MLERVCVHGNRLHQFALMCAVEEYCATWYSDMEIPYADDVYGILSNFFSTDFEDFKRRWKTQFLKSIHAGAVGFYADDGDGCSFELCIKMEFDDEGLYILKQYSNVMDKPFVIGVTDDFTTALFYAVFYLGKYISNWKYKELFDEIKERK